MLAVFGIGSWEAFILLAFLCPVFIVFVAVIVIVFFLLMRDERKPSSPKRHSR